MGGGAFVPVSAGADVAGGDVAEGGIAGGAFAVGRGSGVATGPQMRHPTGNSDAASAASAIAGATRRDMRCFMSPDLTRRGTPGVGPLRSGPRRQRP